MCRAPYDSSAIAQICDRNISPRAIAHEAHAEISLLNRADSDYIPANNKNKGNALGPD
jgi:hypothetical protein